MTRSIRPVVNPEVLRLSVSSELSADAVARLETFLSSFAAAELALERDGLSEQRCRAMLAMQLRGTMLLEQACRVFDTLEPLARGDVSAARLGFPEFGDDVAEGGFE